MVFGMTRPEGLPCERRTRQPDTVKLSVLKKTYIWMPFNMMFCYSEIKKTKYFLDPPPHKKDAGIRAVPIWLHTVKLQSNPFIDNYYSIIIVFSRPHLSIYDKLYTKENTRSFNARATHFKGKLYQTSKLYCTSTKNQSKERNFVQFNKTALSSISCSDVDLC